MFIVYVVQVLVSFDASKVRDHLNTVLYGCHPPHMNTPLTYNIIDKHTVMKCAYLKRCKVQCRLGCGEPPHPPPEQQGDPHCTSLWTDRSLFINSISSGSNSLPVETAVMDEAVVPPGSELRKASSGGVTSPESAVSDGTESSELSSTRSITTTVEEPSTYLDRARQSGIHRQVATKLCDLMGSVTMPESLPDFNSMSESFMSYSNLGRSLIGSAVGFGDYNENKDMEWQEPWVEVDASDFRTRLAGSPVVNDEHRYFDKGSNLKLFAGEEILDKVSAYSLGIHGGEVIGSDGKPNLGSLFLTTYRLLFNGADVHWEVPVNSIASVDDSPGHKSGPKFLYALEITTKTFLQFNVGFTFDISNYTIYLHLVDVPKKSQENSAENVSGGSCHKLQKRNAFAFRYKPSVSKNVEIVPGWANMDLDDEYERLGLTKKKGGGDILGSLAGTSHPWRMSDANSGYSLCPTYPSKIIVPRAIGDEQLERIAGFRGRGRIPAIVYRHPNDATISRCAQPMVGLVRRARCPDDETYIKQLIPSAGKDVYIMDCRSQAAAYGNLAAGRGFEFSANYGGSKLLFMNIENIHAMRDSCRRLFDLGRSAFRNCGDGDSRWWSHLEATRWLEHIRCLMSAASMCARLVEGGHSALIHCSDGWDRTPQLTALTQILLDPFYRTLRGFAILVEKEWCSFGHQFARRSGTLRDGFWDNEECSPIFLQFIDCVFQLISQFPCSFEFNETFLVALLDEVYNGQGGTFLGNSEADRVTAGVPEKCVSSWSLLLPPHKRGSWNFRAHAYVNPLYEGFGVAEVREKKGSKKYRVNHSIAANGEIFVPDNDFLNTGRNVLVPHCHQSNIKIWASYYFRQMQRSSELDGQDSINIDGKTISVDMQIRGIFGNTELLALEALSLRKKVTSLRKEVNELKKLRELSRQDSFDDVEGYVSVRKAGGYSVRRTSLPASYNASVPRSRPISSQRATSRRNSLHSFIQKISPDRWKQSSRNSTPQPQQEVM